MIKLFGNEHKIFMSRGEKWMALTVFVAILAIIASFFVPEVRSKLGLERPAPPEAVLAPPVTPVIPPLPAPAAEPKPEPKPTVHQRAKPTVVGRNNVAGNNVVGNGNLVGNGNVVGNKNQVNTSAAPNIQINNAPTGMAIIGGNVNNPTVFNVGPSPLPPATNQEGTRRENILQRLRNEYILSHDGISSGLLAGTEWPPTDWINERLRQLGEAWRVEPGRNPMELRFIGQVHTSSEPSVQMNNAPNGITIAGGIVNNPTVNNYGALPQPKPTVTICVPQPVMSDGQQQNVIALRTNVKIIQPWYAFFFDAPVLDGTAAMDNHSFGYLHTRAEKLPNPENTFVFRLTSIDFGTNVWSPDEEIKVTVPSRGPVHIVRILTGSEDNGLDEDLVFQCGG